MICFIGWPRASRAPLNSRARSARSTPFLLTNDHTLPQRPATKRRFVPGANVRSSGSSNFGSFGNASSVVYGGGGSGEPLTLELVHGTRRSRPNGLRPCPPLDSAAGECQFNSRAANPNRVARTAGVRMEDPLAE